MELSNEVEGFLDSQWTFKENICTLFEPPCSSSSIRDVEAQAGSSLVNFTIDFVPGGPTIRHMRSRLVDSFLVQEALGNDFTLVLPYRLQLVELTEHKSNSQLRLQLGGLKAVIILQLLFALLGMWGLVVFWTITSRGESCRKQAHGSWRAIFLPSSETLQVLVLSSFVQLILSLSLHLATQHIGGLHLVVVFGLAIGCVGTLFMSLLNSWIRGESPSLRAALSVDQIDDQAPGWFGPDDAEREYRQIYEPGGDRGLGSLAKHDWEGKHINMEKAMGLFDLSNQVFNAAKPEKDPTILAAFLNSTLLGAFGGKKRSDEEAEPPGARDLRVVPVELPPGLPRAMLRDAMLQWRMRHVAHPIELDAVDWLLGQLDPGFELLAVRVPEQARLLVLEALVQHSQQHAELQLDAGHAVRLHSSLQQLSGRFHEHEVSLPDDGQGSAKVRELLVAALKARLEKPGKRDITQEEGTLLQKAIGSLNEAHSLVSMQHTHGTAADEQAQILQMEIESRADAIRAQHADEYMYDNEIFSKVDLVSRTKPPDQIEMLQGYGRGRAARQARAKEAALKYQGAEDTTAAAPAPAAPAAIPRALTRGRGLPPPAALPAPSAVARAASIASIAGQGLNTLPSAARLPPPRAPSGERLPQSRGPSDSRLPPPGSPELGSPALSPRMSPPPSPPADGEQPAANADEAADPSLRKGVSGHLRVWWRFQRRRDAADHGKMPCWKQYLTLLLGSIAVGVCTAAVTTLMSVTPPIVDYFVVFSFSISVPFSLILHWTGRSVIRWLRRRMALARGRRVKGVAAGKHRRKAPVLGNADDAPMAADLEAGGEGQSSTAAGRRPAVLERRGSVHLASTVLDAATTMQERSDAAAKRGQDTLRRRRVSAVMTRNRELKEDNEKEGRRLSLSRESTGLAQSRLTFSEGRVDRAKSRDSALGRAEKIIEGNTRMNKRRPSDGPAESPAPAPDTTSMSTTQFL